ncbi:hypothetical protein LY78DRAFT_433197 [Colletotrichum sublineola]|nr:hypothetical protein LY78DRAFT_433197 [Colletotrichum sublineola]
MYPKKYAVNKKRACLYYQKLLYLFWKMYCSSGINFFASNLNIYQPRQWDEC